MLESGHVCHLCFYLVFQGDLLPLSGLALVGPQCWKPNRVVPNTFAGRGGKGELLLYLRPAKIRMSSFFVPDYTPIFFFFIGMRRAPKDRDQPNSFILPLSPMKHNGKQWSDIRIHGLSSLPKLGLLVVQSVLDSKRKIVPLARSGVEAQGFAHSP